MFILDFIAGLGLLSVSLLLIGLALLIVEMFLPGFGVPGISGLIMTIAGIILGAKTVGEALILLCVILLVLGLTLTFVLRSATRGRLSKTLVLSDRLSAEEGFASNNDLAFFLHKEGLALTTLRPAGTADFDGVKLDVVSESEFIPAQTMVRVIEVNGRRIVVRPLDEQEPKRG